MTPQAAEVKRSPQQGAENPGQVSAHEQALSPSKSGAAGIAPATRAQATLTADHVRYLQRAAGNQAVKNLLGREPVQRTAVQPVQPAPPAHIQRAKDKINFNGYSKSVEHGNKDEFKSTVTKLAMKGTKSVSAMGTPEAVLLMGGSGSGKGSILDQVMSSTQDFVHIDPDAVKSAMPAYQEGLKKGDKNIANAVHAESKNVAGGIFDEALNTRRNLIYDGTGGNLGEYQVMAKRLRKAGYRTKLVMTHVSVDEALLRVAAREQKTGRGIPEAVVRDIYNWVPQNFPKLVNEVDRAYLFDNMVAPGQAPKLIWDKSGGKKLDDDALDYLKTLLARISSSQVDDGKASTNRDDNGVDTKDGGGNASGRYLQEGGTRRWMDDAGSVKFGLNVGRDAISKIDEGLKRYRQYKSKNLSNAQAQADLLLTMQQEVAQSRYQGDEGKDTRTFMRRKKAISLLAQELGPELQSNPNRLTKVGNQSDKHKELLSIGFTGEFLSKALKRDVDLLFHAHAALAHRQMDLAQELLDRLNPPERNQDDSFKYDKAVGVYMERSRNGMQFAQQMLTAHHHANIGGDYGNVFQPKTLDPARAQKIDTKYLQNKDFMGAALDKVKMKDKGKRDLKTALRDFSNLTPQEVEAIRTYTAEQFRPMNATLQDVRVDDQRAGKDAKGWSAINALTVSGMSKLPPFEGVCTYRGDSNFGGLLDTARPGTVFNTPAFFSTTTNKHVTSFFGAGVNWLVLAGPKTRARSMVEIGVAAGENEVLYPPGTKMRVVEIYTRVPNTTASDPAHVAWKPAGKSKMQPEVQDYLDALKLYDRHTMIVVQEMG